MGLLDRLRKRGRPFVGCRGADLREDFESLLGGLQDSFLAQEPSMAKVGAMITCRSPVLILRADQVLQPAAIVPELMLARFWTGLGKEVLETVDLASLLGQLAPLLASSDRLSRAALTDVHELYVSDEAPAAPWPVSDVRLRFASLLLADSVRKLSAGFSDPELIASYGVSRSGTHDEAARQRYEAMVAQEHEWIAAAMNVK